MFFSLMPFYSHVVALFNNSAAHLGIPERVIVLQIRSEPAMAPGSSVTQLLDTAVAKWLSVTLPLRLSETILGQLC